ncbi:hypothetical protein, partial [Tropicimonas sp. IMCC6043]|uniref:hypothetical protein n=1 Tax=Tropicimonas sp. IMCC6043 TaxID=2510645 RepID=UPI001A93015D
GSRLTAIFRRHVQKTIPESRQPSKQPGTEKFDNIPECPVNACQKSALALNRQSPRQPQTAASGSRDDAAPAKRSHSVNGRIAQSPHPTNGFVPG